MDVLESFTTNSRGTAAATAESLSFLFDARRTTASTAAGGATAATAGTREDRGTAAATGGQATSSPEGEDEDEEKEKEEEQQQQKKKTQQQQQQRRLQYVFPTLAELEHQAARRRFHFLNRELVPCRPLVKMFGFAFLSPTAQEEFTRKLRPNVLVPADELQLPLFQAQFLAEAGKVKVFFPSFYNNAIADALSKDALSVDVNRHSQFFFALGLYLCSLLSRFDWPVEDLEGTLKKAQHERRLHILTHYRVLDRVFLSRLTFPEKCIYSELQQAALQSALGGMPFAA